MVRRLSLLIVSLTTVLIAAGCSSTTVISEGTLAGTPSDLETETADATPRADEQSGTSDATDDDEAARGERELGDDTEPPPVDDDLDSVFGLGDDEQLAGLVDDCTDGNDLACDILYQTSALDSDEETLALTCGGRRVEEPSFCTEGIERDGINIWFDDNSPGLVAVVDACEIGEMTACDFLYFRSAIGSFYEELGNTCGGRTEVAIPDCRTVFDAD